MIDAVVKVANEATAVLGERDRLVFIQNKIDASPPLNLEGKTLYREGNSIQFSKHSKKPSDRYLVLCGDMFITSKIVTRAKCTLESVYAVNELQMLPPGKTKNVLSLVVIGTDGNLARFLSYITARDYRKSNSPPSL